MPNSSSNTSRRSSVRGSDGENLLKCSGIHRSFKPGGTLVHVLCGVDFKAARNEWVAIQGASGSGKTTLLNILGTLDTPDKGEVVCDGVEYSSMSRRAKASFRNAKLGFVFQAYHMLPELSILENVRLPAMILGKSSKVATKKAEELLDSVGLKERIAHMPTELSGGEKQRAAIARSLVNSPELLLADEPTGNLDSHAGQQILKIFSELRDNGITKSIVMITHDAEVAAWADRKIILKDGKVEDAV